jgi:hypothetical protein
MKLRYVTAGLVLVAIGTTVVLRLNRPNYAPPLSSFYGGELTFIHPPPAIAQQIETLATDSIVTTAPAGTQSHAWYTDYTSNSVIGYLTYDANPKLLASFVAHKDVFGHWHITDQKHGTDRSPQ